MHLHLQSLLESKGLSLLWIYKKVSGAAYAGKTCGKPTNEVKPEVRYAP